MAQTFREKHDLLKEQVVKKFNRLMGKHNKPIDIPLGLERFVYVNDKEKGIISVKVIEVDKTNLNALVSINSREIKQYEFSELNGIMDKITILEMVANIK